MIRQRGRGEGAARKPPRRGRDGEAEAAFRESESRFRLIAETSIDWTFWQSPEGRFLFVSPSCRKTTGYAAEDFLEDPGLTSRIIHPAD